MSASKITVGLIEPIEVIGKNRIKVLGKFDTGARRTSIDKKIAAAIGTVTIGSKIVKNVHGDSIRPLVHVTLRIRGKKIDTEATVADRSSRSYKVLIGRDVIHSNFVIDVSKSHTTPSLRDIK